MTDTATAAKAGAPESKIQPRLKQKYRNEIAAQLTKDFGFTNPHQVPGLVKVVVNTGVGEAARDGKIIDGLGPNGVSWLMARFGKGLGRIQSGYVYHRPEAPGDERPQVHRSVQAARGPAHRRPRHPSR